MRRVEGLAAKFRLVCVDMCWVGHGDVLPAGAAAAGRSTLHIARVNTNHFVPLQPSRVRGGTVPRASTLPRAEGGSASSSGQAHQETLGAAAASSASKAEASASEPGFPEAADSAVDAKAAAPHKTGVAEVASASAESPSDVLANGLCSARQSQCD
jgi:hypothetical protein